MKILESRPERYDRGIALVSLGQADRVKRRIVLENVSAGSRVLEIGVGTGTMALLAAKRGASVLGFDVSASMLSVARGKVSGSGFEEQVELIEMGVSGMDQLPESSFDLVASTLVFSELWRDERAYALRHAWRALKPGGRLALADEVRPGSMGKRLFSAAVRLPLVVATFALTQTTTRAVAGLPEQVEAAGFRIVTRELAALDSFLYLVASKAEGE